MPAKKKATKKAAGVTGWIKATAVKIDKKLGLVHILKSGTPKATTKRKKNGSGSRRRKTAKRRA